MHLVSFVVFDFHNDRGKTSLEQASSERLLFMTKPQLIEKTMYQIPHK